MSTDDQVNSLANQAAVIAAYAQARGYEIVRSYEDAGVSGVRTKGRAAFKALLATVLGGQADFEVILVADVSRWGRFQDPDEAGHYEFLCAREGVRIAYCAESFAEGEGVGGALMKGLKRAMAAEFSRELGVKVRRAQARLAAQGHWQHGRPGYGLRRQLTAPDGEPVRLLQDGERNTDPSFHTRLVAGPAAERAVVRRIHRCFALEGRPMYAIAEDLNREGARAEGGGAWTAARVRQVLTNPKYAGDLVTHRRGQGSEGRQALRSPDQWVVARGAAPALITRKAFAATQAALSARAAPPDEALLAQLRQVVEAHGVVGEARLKALGCLHVRSYRTRFGSLREAYGRLGHTPPSTFPKHWSDKAMLDGLVTLFLRHGAINSPLIDADEGLPCAEAYRARFGGLAKAYARIGYVPIGPRELASPVGRARAEACRVRLERWPLGDTTG